MTQPWPPRNLKTSKDEKLARMIIGDMRLLPWPQKEPQEPESGGPGRGAACGLSIMQELELRVERTLRLGWEQLGTHS